MPRTYIPKPFADSRRKPYHKHDLEEAVDAVIAGMSSYQAAIRFEVPRGTIAGQVAHYRRTGVRKNIGEGRPTYLSNTEESLLVTIITTRAEAGFPMDKGELLELISEYLTSIGK